MTPQRVMWESARPATTEYRVWAVVTTWMEEAPASHVVAEFRFLQEALDYVADVTRRGTPVTLTGPYGMASTYPKGTVTP